MAGKIAEGATSGGKAAFLFGDGLRTTRSTCVN
jgi:hypothetical protein